jgi:hypothetical protein
MNKLDGRTVVILPASADGLRGPQQSLALAREARALADAIVGALDRIDIFDDNGGLMFLARGGLHPVNAEVLRAILRANFASKHIVNVATGLEVEFRPVEPGELVIRTLLTAAPQDGGLLGRLPKVIVERPQADHTSAPEEVGVVPDSVEAEAGRRALARHDGRSERLKEEMEAGARRLRQLQDRPPQV